ncbi:hypothetical protein SRABI128_01902 [Microbacterium sp. Bi128]|nr:hypothetical protein SRABI128_01902 [Microbacterium sp. Bi128]
MVGEGGRDRPAVGDHPLHRRGRRLQVGLHAGDEVVFEGEPPQRRERLVAVGEQRAHLQVVGGVVLALVERVHQDAPLDAVEVAVRHGADLLGILRLGRQPGDTAPAALPPGDRTRPAHADALVHRGQPLGQALGRDEVQTPRCDRTRPTGAAGVHDDVGRPGGGREAPPPVDRGLGHGETRQGVPRGGGRAQFAREHRPCDPAAAVRGRDRDRADRPQRERAARRDGELARPRVHGGDGSLGHGARAVEHSRESTMAQRLPRALDLFGGRLLAEESPRHRPQERCEGVSVGVDQGVLEAGFGQCGRGGGVQRKGRGLRRSHAPSLETTGDTPPAGLSGSLGWNAGGTAPGRATRPAPSPCTPGPRPR